MSVILTPCPTTREPVSTGQHATAAQFEATDFNGRFRCTSCGQVHEWSKPQAHLAQPLRTSSAG